MIKKQEKIAISFIFLLLLTNWLSGCTYGMHDVNTMKYTAWSDSNAGMYFRTLDSFGDGYGFVTINGQKEYGYFRIGVGKPGSLNIILFDENVLFTDGEFKESLSFNVHYKGGKIISNQKNLTVFGQEYSQLVFTKSDFDRNTIDASEYRNFEWTDEGGNLTFYIGYYDFARGPGTAVVNGTEKEIMFVWLKDKRFEIYLGHEPKSTDEPAAYGTYTNNQSEAVLTFSYDSLFNNQFATLTINANKR